MTTLVSAYVFLPTNQNRSIEKYIKYGKKWFDLDIPKVIFIDELVIDKFTHFQNDKTIILPTKLTDIYLYNYRKLITNEIRTDNPSKDTHEYFMTICHKTEWVRKAIKINPFNSSNFVWADFGLYHVFRNKEKIVDWNRIYNIYSTVRIAAIWDLNRPDLPEKWKLHIYKDIYWYFCGGVFGGHRDALVQFADYTKEKCLQLIQSGVLVWDVNVWYLVYQEHPELFDPYLADHNETIINNY